MTSSLHCGSETHPLEARGPVCTLLAAALRCPPSVPTQTFPPKVQSPLRPLPPGMRALAGRTLDGCVRGAQSKALRFWDAAGSGRPQKYEVARLQVLLHSWREGANRPLFPALRPPPRLRLPRAEQHPHLRPSSAGPGRPGSLRSRLAGSGGGECAVPRTPRLLLGLCAGLQGAVSAQTRPLTEGGVP